MTSAVAESVMAATHKLVQQAMHGEWQEVPKTIEQRRVLLERLTANASPRDRQWLGALRQAMAESDAAIAKMAAVVPAEAVAAEVAPSLTLPRDTGEGTHEQGFEGDTAQVDCMLELLKAGR